MYHKRIARPIVDAEKRIDHLYEPEQTICWLVQQKADNGQTIEIVFQRYPYDFLDSLGFDPDTFFDRYGAVMAIENMPHGRLSVEPVLCANQSMAITSLLKANLSKMRSF